MGIAAGFSDDWLQFAAGVVGINDRGDEQAIQIGVDLYNTHGEWDLAQGDVDSAVRSNSVAFALYGKAKTYQYRLIPNV